LTRAGVAPSRPGRRDLGPKDLAMKRRLIGAAMAAALLVAGCQTTAGPPPGGGRAALTEAGFTRSSARSFNRNLAPDDIVTTAVYECETQRCGGLSLVALGRFVRGGDMRMALDQITAAEPSRRVALAREAFGDSIPRTFAIEAVTPFTLPDGRNGAEIDARIPEGGSNLYIRMAIAFQGVNGRTAMALSPSRETAQTFGSRWMIE
jgi:hypothetical protein